MAQNKFIVQPSWQFLVKDAGLDVQDVLRAARLPLDLFSQDGAAITTEEYFRVLSAMEHLSGDPLFPLQFGKSISVEAFSPPIFACFCSPDFNVAVKRLAQYKPLIGPMQLNVQVLEDRTRVQIGGLPDHLQPPVSFIVMELVFKVHMARMALREPVIPVEVTVTRELPAMSDYEEFFGTSIDIGKYNGVALSAEDAVKPFLSANEAMWSVFEPDLRKRMSDLGISDGFRERVRACLTEIIASGECSMADVASRLGVSTRTLQRRLSEEGTSFQQELNQFREQLARHYLNSSHYSGAEIAFLLGYEDPNSFIRAFHSWTGQSPEQAREHSKAS